MANDLSELIRRVYDLYRRTKECREGLEIPAVDRALDLAAMHLHDALWVLGADVGLNPDFDAPSDPAGPSTSVKEPT